MLFNSLHFLIFFALAALVYFLLPLKHRWFWLLLVSVYFYATFTPAYLIILLVVIVLTYFTGLKIEQTEDKTLKKIYFFISIISACAILFTFKYYNFFAVNINFLASLLHWNYSVSLLSLLLPIGISFYIFQSLAYVIEVYRGNYKAEKNFGIYSLYVMFFPQILSGPIGRPSHLLPQLKQPQRFDFDGFFDGIKRMCWGFFKKLVIADRLAMVVNMVYGNLQDYTGIPLIVATVFFAFQLYCDFSGYTDIAIGAAKVLGVNLAENFRQPYLSKSIRDFWKRWHISLMDWFRDYIYLPLGGSRVKVSRWLLNIMAVFLISGLWHGANWTFIIWGGLNGIYILFSVLTSKIRNKMCSKIGLAKHEKLHNFFKIAVTFALINISWIFFRADSLSDAVYILMNIFSGWSLRFPVRHGGVGGWPGFLFSIFLILFLMLVQVIQETVGASQFFSNKPAWIKGAVYIIILLLILLFGVFGSNPFIYFQF